VAGGAASKVGLSPHARAEQSPGAAQEDRVILSHDVSAMTAYAYARMADGLPMAGVSAVSQSLSISRALDDLLLLAECSLAGEWAGQVRYLPL
jgi:hypothetical protein